ncbi:MAG: hypothetical protein IPG97_02945 [Microthrixaceae bacterium]|nr:hypothetical protein [Microthrixaceae bacterium]
MSVVLSGRRNGSTHREVALLASLPGELRLIGGLVGVSRGIPPTVPPSISTHWPAVLTATTKRSPGWP